MIVFKQQIADHIGAGQTEFMAAEVFSKVDFKGAEACLRGYKRMEKYIWRFYFPQEKGAGFLRAPFFMTENPVIRVKENTYQIAFYGPWLNTGEKCYDFDKAIFRVKPLAGNMFYLEFGK